MREEMSLPVRSLIVTARQSEAIDDLNEVLEMTDAAGSVNTEARRKLVRMERTANWAATRQSLVNSHAQGGTHARADAKAAGKHTD